MSDFDKWQTEDRRLVILAILAESGGYTTNEYLLRQVLEIQGHAISKARLRTDLDWLKEQGLLKFNEIHDMRIATINDRGIDVSKGLATVSGVKRPEPGE